MNTVSKVFEFARKGDDLLAPKHLVEMGAQIAKDGVYSDAAIGQAVAFAAYAEYTSKQLQEMNTRLLKALQTALPNVEVYVDNCDNAGFSEGDDLRVITEAIKDAIRSGGDE